DTYSFSPTFIGSFRYGFVRKVNTNERGAQGFNPADLKLPPVIVNNQAIKGWPGFNLGEDAAEIGAGGALGTKDEHAYNTNYHQLHKPARQPQPALRHGLPSDTLEPQFAWQRCAGPVQLRLSLHALRPVHSEFIEYFRIELRFAAVGAAGERRAGLQQRALAAKPHVLVVRAGRLEGEPEAHAQSRVALRPGDALHRTL